MTRLTCILCPLGCDLEVDAVQPAAALLAAAPSAVAPSKDARPAQKIVEIKGNGCPRGEEYAVGELTNPTRLVTSTVAVRGGTLSRLPVRTAREIPRALISEAMAQLHAATAEAPIKRGEVILPDVAGTGVPAIAARSVPPPAG